MGRGAGPLPAPARLFDVSGGMWRHRAKTLEPQSLHGLKSSVQVAWDHAGVPHFFASHEADLYRAQGYVMASQRLFQLDLVTRKMAGRLSEWVGDKTLESDRFFIRFGMRDSARATLDRYRTDPTSKMMIESFTDGINSYIDGLTDLPPEYRILGVQPEHFDPIRVVYMDKVLTYDLSSRSLALYLSKMQQQLGTQKVLDLFPEFLPNKFEDFVIRQAHNQVSRKPEAAAQFSFISHLKELPAVPLANPRNGSNNWAIGPALSKSGVSIMANDTHLDYALPNIWYENQLSSPDFNVYGVSLVAIPGIVNGFNANRVAWGPTNGTTTTLDFFEIEFESETSKRYRYQNTWLEPEIHVELLARRGDSDEQVPVIWTKLGPLLHREGRYGLVANWLGHRTNQELKALQGLYSAKSAQDCRASFRNWAVPIQNFICVDPEHISIRHTGYVPQRDVGSGRFVMNGNLGEDSFAKEVPENWHPQEVDPKEGFVLSANQRIEGPQYPYYLGWDYEEPYRGMTIRRRIKDHAVSKLDPQDLMAMQNDSYDAQAETLLPLLLKLVNKESLSPDQIKYLQQLESWNYLVRAQDSEPSFFKSWIRNLNLVLFDSVLPPVGGKRLYPKSLRVAWLLERLLANPNDSDKQWIKGDLKTSVTEAYVQSWKELGQKYGPSPNSWDWKTYNKANLKHMAHLPGFGSPDLAMDGSGESIRGNRGNHGPVYKAVMEMSNPPRAWIEVPGGNEGDPFSVHYGQRVEEWSQGKMREVEFYNNIEEARQKAVRIVELKP